MYLYQPALLALTAWTAAGLFPLSRKRRALYTAMFLLTLAASFLRVEKPNWALFPAALLLLAGSAGFCWGHWSRILLAGVFGGAAAWRLTDLFPLCLEGALPGSLCLCLFVLLYVRDIPGRLCACALGGIVCELGFCLQEYFLFTYARWRIGSALGLSISAFSMCLVYGVYGILTFFRQKKARHHGKNIEYGSVAAKDF